MLRLNCDKPVSDGRRSRGTKRKPPPNLRRKRIWRLSHDHDSNTNVSIHLKFELNRVTYFCMRRNVFQADTHRITLL